MPAWRHDQLRRRRSRRCAVVADSLALIDGWLPPRALRLTLEWAAERANELHANWDRARAHEPLAAVDPLP